MPCARPAARTSHSPASFVSPYGFIGTQGVSSVTSSTSGLPYTAAEEEKTKRSMPASATASSSVARPPTFSR